VTIVPEEITVILNAYRRQDYLSRQIQAVSQQTLPPAEILVWNNGQALASQDLNYSGTIIANSSKNFGVWSRFALALNSETEYICILDDDTFPGLNFFKSCVGIVSKYNCLVGARGLRFLTNTSYSPFLSFGWDNPNENLEEVDIIGHAWFFRREWLSYFWRELPVLNTSRMVGEAIHFSYCLRRYGGIKSCVGPHPLRDQSVWGSDPHYARVIGGDSSAISTQHGSFERFDAAYRLYISKGMVILNDLTPTEHSGENIHVIPVRRFYRVINFIKSVPILRKIAQSISVFLKKFNIYV